MPQKLMMPDPSGILHLHHSSPEYPTCGKKSQTQWWISPNPQPNSDILFTVPEEMLGFPASSKDLPFASSKIFFRKAPICHGQQFENPTSKWSKGGRNPSIKIKLAISMRYVNEMNDIEWSSRFGSIFGQNQGKSFRSESGPTNPTQKLRSSVLKHIGYGCPLHDWLSVVSLVDVYGVPELWFP